MLPVIGITTYGRTETDVKSRHYDDHYTAPAFYVDSVRRAGGVPVLLPPDEPNISAWLSMVDGIVVAGGSDIDPTLYGGNAAHPELTDLAADRDRSEFELVKQLMESGATPTLLICRGMQVANVVAGGTLIEHIPDHHAADIHRDTTGGWTLQTVDVHAGTKLEQAMDAQQVTTYSGHHQAVSKVGKDLVVNAVAPDGVIEGLELPTHRFFLAVQWHPEMSAMSDKSQQGLFNALVSAAQQ